MGKKHSAADNPPGAARNTSSKKKPRRSERSSPIEKQPPSDRCPAGGEGGWNWDQAAAIPYRFRGERLEFCLITSARRGRWSFPKGVVDPGETPAQTALKEAEEEAGLSGAINGPPLGQFRYRKWGRQLNVLVLLMEVAEAAEQWAESDVRHRRWVSASKVERRLEKADFQPMVRAALDRLGSGRSGADRDGPTRSAHAVPDAG